jgi:hypothetical protein
MPDTDQLPLSRTPVRLPRGALRSMLRLVRLTFALSNDADYRRLVLPQLPELARFDPGHAGLMMGYDFHLAADGPRLIEVNTNAGGGYLSWLAAARASGADPERLPKRMATRLLQSFYREWSDFSGSEKPLRRVAIVDEEPEQQHLYPEMRAFCDWLTGLGLAAEILDPEQLQADDGGVFSNGRPVDLVYNRHCDFFLESPRMAGLRAAYLARSVCLSPNPFVYGLLADKRRMVLWSDEQQLRQLGLNPRQRKLLLELVPRSRLLADCDPQQIWRQRKELVFKPVTRFGSRGVLMGKSVSRHRFAEQDPATTLVQQLAPPGLTEAQGEAFKTDLRLYVYRNRLLGIGARLYQGQVTNLRTVGGGFAPLLLV